MVLVGNMGTKLECFLDKAGTVQCELIFEGKKLNEDFIEVRKTKQISLNGPQGDHLTYKRATYRNCWPRSSFYSPGSHNQRVIQAHEVCSVLNRANGLRSHIQ